MSELQGPSAGTEPGEYQHVRLEQRGATAFVTMNRPEVRNAFNARLILELADAFARLGADEQVRAIVLRGEGRTFSAGADLNWMRSSLDFTHDENVADALRMSDMLRAIDDCPCPVIGRIHGAALGGGVGLTAVCDIAIAEEGCRFGFTETRLGIAPGLRGAAPRVKGHDIFGPVRRDRTAVRHKLGLPHDTLPSGPECEAPFGN